jgi:hypothetical protein
VGWALATAFWTLRPFWYNGSYSEWSYSSFLPLCRTMPFTASTPFYRWGKTRSLQIPYDVNATYKLLQSEPASLINTNTTTATVATSWVLPSPLQHPLRNHETILLEQANGRYHLLQLLGRYSRVIQWMDLITGQQDYRITYGKDPDGYPLNDLNHVEAVVVDSLDGTTREAWLICGFAGDAPNSEESIHYARIVDLRDMVVRVGPKLPSSGGACVALALEIDGPGTPPHICSVGGTKGNHDTGTFLSQTACYDRTRQQWHYVLGRLPYGLDHGNGAVLPAGTCHASDPARIVLLNFRTYSYGEQRPEILALDWPKRGYWTPAQVHASIEEHEQIETSSSSSSSSKSSSPWYVFANFSYAPYQPWRHNSDEDNLNRARDASGVVMANGGRYLLNFAGVSYRYPTQQEQAAEGLPPKITKHTSQVRMLDVCATKPNWSAVADLGLSTFAVLTAASAELNLAFTCGGDVSHQRHRNNPWCVATRIPGVQLDNERGNLSSLAPNFVDRSVLGRSRNCSAAF